MYIATIEEEIVDRGSSRGFYRFPKLVRFTGLVRIISQYTPIKQSRFTDSISNKAVVICLPELNLVEDQSGLDPCIPPTSEKILGYYFLNLCTNSVINHIACIIMCYNHYS